MSKKKDRFGWHVLFGALDRCARECNDNWMFLAIHGFLRLIGHQAQIDGNLDLRKRLRPELSMLVKDFFEMTR